MTTSTSSISFVVMSRRPGNDLISLSSFYTKSYLAWIMCGEWIDHSCGSTGSPKVDWHEIFNFATPGQLNFR